MLQKNRLKLYKILIFNRLLVLSTLSRKFSKLPQITSLEFSNKHKLNNTSHFFKKITFIFLALSNVFFSKYNNLKTRSIITSL